MIDNENKVAMVKMTAGGMLSSLTVITLNQWVAFLTIAYFVLQIGLLVPKYFELYKTWRNRKCK